jgi:pimeloyl-ACP methyl ester carboxylesterase
VIAGAARNLARKASLAKQGADWRPVARRGRNILNTVIMQPRRFQATDNLLINCLDYGGEGRPPLLFLHGGSAHAHWWDYVAPAFTNRFHVMALDQRGHGDSPWTAQWAYGTRHYIADLHAIIRGWEFGAPVLVGHSMGGHNVMVYAGTHGEAIRAMAAIDSPATYPDFAKQALKEMAERPSRRFDSLEAAVTAFRTVPNNSLAAPEIMRHVALSSFRQDSDGKWIHKMDRRTMLRDPIDGWPLLPRIKCPALYIRPRFSALQPDYVEKIAAKMPRGRLALVPDAHHHVLLDNPTGLVAALEQFFAQIR